MKILVITGSTATGKTDIALGLARRWGGELVGCDSVQVYRGFDIGSAKPSPDELAGIAHHLIDILDPDESVDAMHYASLADRAIEEIHGRARIPIVVGGTGLWLRALIRGLVELPTPDLEIRSRLDGEVERLGAPQLHARLATIDPRSAQTIHPNDAVRVVRALEVFEQTGTPLGELRAAHALGAPRHQALVFALDRQRAELYSRIDQRIDAMIERGWLNEAQQLYRRWGGSVRAFGSVGYHELLGHIAEGRSWSDTVQHIRKATRIYARRQRTWIASDPDVNWRGDPREMESETLRIESFLAY